MTDVHTEPCRVTVHGPGGRADVAVPQSLSIASLLPVLARRTGATDNGSREPLVLQRLGAAPLDPSGTPESLDWRHGEEFYLRPATDPLPEFDFDDVVDGLATMVSRQSGRWRPEYNKGLFLGLSIVMLVVLGAVVVRMGSVAGALAVAVALLAGTGVAIGRSADRTLLLVLGIGGCGFAAIAGMLTGGAGAVLHMTSSAVLSGGLALAIAAGVVLAGRLINPAQVPMTPFGALALTGLLAALAQWLRLSVALTPAQVAGVVCAGLLVLLVFAPRLAIRLARIRGPQLATTAEELQQDTDPIAAEDIERRSAHADGFLTVAVVAAAVFCLASFPFLLADGVFATVLAVLLTLVLTLRARAYQGAWQRAALGGCGAAGFGLIAWSLTGALAPAGQGIAVVVLIAGFGLLAAAMVRPSTRRLLPVWGHLANIVESIAAIAVLPVLLELFGVYARVAGRG